MKAFRFELECHNKYDLAKQLKAIEGVNPPNESLFVKSLLEIGEMVHQGPEPEGVELRELEEADVISDADFIPISSDRAELKKVSIATLRRALIGK